MTAWRKHIIFACFILMLGGLFFSRALLSSSMILFTLVSFIHTGIRDHLKNFTATPVLWSMSVLFLVPLISGAWSDDKKNWLDMMQIKLPLLFLPLAFAAPFSFSNKEWRLFAYIFIAFVLGGTIWSIAQYLNDMNLINESYLQSGTIKTPFENDHVRFSWLVSITVLLCCSFLFRENENRFIRITVSILAGWFIIYLHILAARTGLLSLYIILVMGLIWLILKKLNFKYAITLLLLLIAMPVTAWFIFPTLQNRVRYFLYEAPFFRKTDYQAGHNDMVRVISLKAGWNIMNQSPLPGAGFGDILSETKKWYAEHYPQMIEKDKIYPSGEWAVYGAGCGWPGLIVFLTALLVPFFTAMKRNKLSWILLNTAVLFSFLFDIGLEVQFGVFVYSFTVLCWWKSLQQIENS
jgi:hypothetical protein